MESKTAYQQLAKQRNKNVTKIIEKSSVELTYFMKISWTTYI